MRVLQLQQKGQLKLTDTLRHFFPKLPYYHVTIRQLLTPTSGIRDYEALFEQHWDRGKIAQNKDVIALLPIRTLRLILYRAPNGPIPIPAMYCWLPSWNDLVRSPGSVIIGYLAVLTIDDSFQPSLSFDMKYAGIVYLLILLVCGCERSEPVTKLLTEQKRLKDSVVIINEKIGEYLQKGFGDSAAAQKKQLGAVHARLATIQSSIDSRSKTGQ